MRTFLLIFLLLWLLGGYFLCKKHLCGDSGPTQSESSKTVPVIAGDDVCSSKLYLKDKATDFDKVCDENFQFLMSSDTYLTPGTGLTQTLSDVIDYLGAHPDRRIQIKGYYLENEDNNTNYQDLGLARANYVKTYFLEQGVNSEQLTTLGKLGNDSCFENDTLKKGIAIAFGERVQ